MRKIGKVNAKTGIRLTKGNWKWKTKTKKRKLVTSPFTAETVIRLAGVGQLNAEKSKVFSIRRRCFPPSRQKKFVHMLLFAENFGSGIE